MEELFSAVVLPDDDMAELIEAAFLEGQIDGSRADLAYLWLMQNRTEVRRGDGAYVVHLLTLTSANPLLSTLFLVAAISRRFAQPSIYSRVPSDS